MTKNLCNTYKLYTATDTEVILSAGTTPKTYVYDNTFTKLPTCLK